MPVIKPMLAFAGKNMGSHMGNVLTVNPIRDMNEEREG